MRKDHNLLLNLPCSYYPCSIHHAQILLLANLLLTKLILSLFFETFTRTDHTLNLIFMDSNISGENLIVELIFSYFKEDFDHINLLIYHKFENFQIVKSISKFLKLLLQAKF